MIERLFDIVYQRVQTEPDGIMLAGKVNGVYVPMTARQVLDAAIKLAAGLQQLGISPDIADIEQQEKIAIVSPNRTEWLITDLACQLCGAVLTPIYPTISENDFGYILQEAGVHIVFLAGQELYERFEGPLTNTPGLSHIISFDRLTNNPQVTFWQDLQRPVTSFDDSLSKNIHKDTIATIIYTSGTTGNPKGVMLSHRNIVSNVLNALPEFSFAEKGARALSFLPLNHVYERMVSYIYLHSGVGIYYAENMETIGDNLREVKPIVFTTVPRLLEKVYERILHNAMTLTGLKKKLFFWALELGKQYDNARPASLSYQLQLQLANKLVFSKWREALGGNVKAIVTGASACQERLVRIFSAAGIVIMEGYGLSETSPVISVNQYASEGRRVGTVGPVLRNVSVKLADDGEILVKGDNVMVGYYKHPEMTAATIQNGWLHTGDIGTLVENRFLKITDRKKEMFKTANGKYVAPQVIENRMKESPFIEQIMVVGADRKYVGALIIPAMKMMKKHLQENGLDAPDDPVLFAKHPPVTELIHKHVQQINGHFGQHEQIKRFAIICQEWTIDTGELTPSLKLRRKIIEARYQADIEQIFT